MRFPEEERWPPTRDISCEEEVIRLAFVACLHRRFVWTGVEEIARILSQTRLNISQLETELVADLHHLFHTPVLLIQYRLVIALALLSAILMRSHFAELCLHPRERSFRSKAQNLVGYANCYWQLPQGRDL